MHLQSSDAYTRELITIHKTERPILTVVTMYERHRRKGIKCFYDCLAELPDLHLPLVSSETSQEIRPSFTTNKLQTVWAARHIMTTAEKGAECVEEVRREISTR